MKKQEDNTLHLDDDQYENVSIKSDSEKIFKSENDCDLELDSDSAESSSSQSTENGQYPFYFNNHGEMTVETRKISEEMSHCSFMLWTHPSMHESCSVRTFPHYSCDLRAKAMPYFSAHIRKQYRVPVSFNETEREEFVCSLVNLLMNLSVDLYSGRKWNKQSVKKVDLKAISNSFIAGLLPLPLIPVTWVMLALYREKIKTSLINFRMFSLVNELIEQQQSVLQQQSSSSAVARLYNATVSPILPDLEDSGLVDKVCSYSLFHFLLNI